MLARVSARRRRGHGCLPTPDLAGNGRLESRFAMPSRRGVGLPRAANDLSGRVPQRYVPGSSGLPGPDNQSWRIVRSRPGPWIFGREAGLRQRQPRPREFESSRWERPARQSVDVPIPRRGSIWLGVPHVLGHHPVDESVLGTERNLQRVGGGVGKRHLAGQSAKAMLFPRRLHHHPHSSKSGRSWCHRTR